MSIRELVLFDRSYRRFDESVPVTRELLTDWVDTARLTNSSVNIQPLKYFVSAEKETNAIIRSHIYWARNLPDFNGPAEGENPTGYVVICVDSNCSGATAERFAKDVGIAAQTIMLCAAEKGFGGCMMGNVDRDELKSELELPESCTISLVLAIGKPGERIILEEVDEGESVKYYRDENNIHYVPKRKLKDILL